MKRKPPASHNIGIDKDPKALSAFHCDYPVQLINGCAHEFLASYPYTGRELVYCDPPYLLETRIWGRPYRFDYTLEDHACRKKRCGLLTFLKSHLLNRLKNAVVSINIYFIYEFTAITI